MNILSIAPLAVSTILVYSVYGLALWKGDDADVQFMRHFTWLWIIGLCLTIFL